MWKVEIKEKETEHLYSRETIIYLSPELFKKAKNNGNSRSAILKKVIKSEIEKALREMPLPLKVKSIRMQKDHLIINLDGTKLLKEALKVAKKHNLKMGEEFLTPPQRALNLIFELEGINLERLLDEVENTAKLFSAISYYDEMFQQQIMKLLKIKNTETGEEISLFKPVLVYVGLNIPSTDWLKFKKEILSIS